jgi:hypothetical protein
MQLSLLSSGRERRVLDCLLNVVVIPADPEFGAKRFCVVVPVVFALVHAKKQVLAGGGGFQLAILVNTEPGRFTYDEATRRALVVLKVE